jgi:hypothetical protein
MTKRRMGTRPHKTFWTAEGTALIEAYQAQHLIPSFSAAAETLVRLGLQQSPTEVITPVIATAIRKTIHSELERLIKLQIYAIVEAGIAQRFAAAAVRDLGRLKHDDPARYDDIKAAAIADTRRRLARDNIGRVVADLYAELMATDALPAQDPETAARREA